MEGFENNDIRFALEEEVVQGAKIKVVGVGGGGGNAINRMVEAGIQGVEFISANTDMQALKTSLAQVRLQLGARLTKGLGAGSNPEIGRQAALEDTEKLISLLEGADMVFITAGLGGGTGTGAAPIFASLASELNALTVAVVTKPFQFEGRKRIEQSEMGLRELRECADTVITIPNERLLYTVEKGTSLSDAFRIADDVLCQAVQGIADLITIPGIINVDFADVKTVMCGMGMALMGTGLAQGEGRAVEAVKKAISSPLLEETSIKGARGVLVNVSGSKESMSLHEINEALTIVHEAADSQAHIIFGSVFDERMGDKIKITVIATGFDEKQEQRPAPVATLEKAPAETRVPVRKESSFVPQPELVNTFMGGDLDIPTFIRRKAR